MMHYVLKLIIIATATILSSGYRKDSSNLAKLNSNQIWPKLVDGEDEQREESLLGDTSGTGDEEKGGEDAEEEGGEDEGGEDAEDEDGEGADEPSSMREEWWNFKAISKKVKHEAEKAAKAAAKVAKDAARKIKHEAEKAARAAEQKIKDAKALSHFRQKIKDAKALAKKIKYEAEKAARAAENKIRYAKALAKKIKYEAEKAARAAAKVAKDAARKVKYEAEKAARAAAKKFKDAKALAQKIKDAADKAAKAAAKVAKDAPPTDGGVYQKKKGVCAVALTLEECKDTKDTTDTWNRRGIVSSGNRPSGCFLEGPPGGYVRYYNLNSNSKSDCGDYNGKRSCLCAGPA